MTLRNALAAPAILIGLSSCAGISGASAAAEDAQTYVLVHGAWGGGWAYKPLDSILTSEGHDFYRPTMTGLGDRAHLARPDIDLTTHVQDIVNTILFEDLKNVVLVAHSYGGMVASGVAQRIPERLRCVVYFDAFLPEDGESLLTSSRGQEREAARKQLVASAKDGLIAAPGPPGVARVATGLDRRAPQPVRTLTQKLTLDNPAADAIPSMYILTVEAGTDSANDDFAPYAARGKARGWRVEVMTGGHVPVGKEWGVLARLLCDLPD